MDKKNNSKRNLLIIGVILALAFGWVTLYLVNQVQAVASDITCQGYRLKFDRVDGEWIIDDPGFYINFKPDGQKGVSWTAHAPLNVTAICVKEGGPDGGTLHYPSPANFGTLLTSYDVSHIAFNYDGDKGDITPTPTDEDKEETPTPTVETPTPTVETPTETPTIETPTETPTIETPTETPTIETPTETPTIETPTETPTIETPTETPTVETPSPTPTATDEPSGATVAVRPTTLWQSFLQWLCQIGINLGGCY